MKPPYKTMDDLRSFNVDEFIAQLREKKLDYAAAGWGVEVTEILLLMAALDAFKFLEDTSLKDDSWKPKSDQVRVCIARLIAPENRQALRSWYRKIESEVSRKTALNPAAERLRRYLSHLIREEL